MVLANLFGGVIKLLSTEDEPGMRRCKEADSARIRPRSWFFDPSAPWQKGAVENTNKRIGRFLAVIPQHALNRLARDLNNQPRKCLGFQTPAEVFMANLQEGG
ncbi:hypothetical protein [Ensifer sp. 4252]|uniref:hypothetical protein n=1 Tax=Ensifer sp. 4252 TaxID=3373915 RepID=UPI003D1B7333